MDAELLDVSSVRVRFADTREFVDVYTRQLMRGTLFLPLEKIAGVNGGELLRVQVELPADGQTFEVEGEVGSRSEAPPRGLWLETRPLDPALGSALEAYLTEVVRGDAPSTRLPAGGSGAVGEGADAAGDAALAFQEEATGAAQDGRSIQTQLREMSHAERVRLALTGGKAARAALIRSPQPTYHGYVVQNPRVTRQELAALAKNPNAAPDALRQIAANAQHMADPAIRLSIVRNPKTDPQVAQKFLSRLSQTQLRQLARSDDVRAPIKSGAVRLLQRSGRS